MASAFSGSVAAAAAGAQRASAEDMKDLMTTNVWCARSPDETKFRPSACENPDTLDFGGEPSVSACYRGHLDVFSGTQVYCAEIELTRTEACWAVVTLGSRIAPLSWPAEDVKHDLSSGPCSFFRGWSLFDGQRSPRVRMATERVERDKRATGQRGVQLVVKWSVGQLRRRQRSSNKGTTGAANVAEERPVTWWSMGDETDLGRRSALGLEFAKRKDRLQ